MALLIILVASQLDKVAGTEVVRNAVIIGYIANEALSIIENAGLMGLPVPKFIINAIDILKKNRKVMQMIKICLDAGHYGKYNQSPANKKYWESETMWKLTEYLKEELLSYKDTHVITTRKEQEKTLPYTAEERCPKVTICL